MVERLRRELARRGLLAVARRVVGIARERLYLEETHVWYELALDGQRTPRPLMEGLVLVEADDRQTGLLDQLPAMSSHDALRLRTRGARLFLVLKDRLPLFACWIHTAETPAIAARGGWLSLPPGTVCLEDSLTAPAARGLGVAPGAWSELASRLAAEGVDTMITKVQVENTPSRRAVEKAGFQEAGVMRLRRLGPRARVTISDDSPLAAHLRRALGR